MTRNFTKNMWDAVTWVSLVTTCAVLLVFRYGYAQETLDAGNPAYETKKQEALSILKENEEDPLVQVLIKAMDDPAPGVIAQYIAESAIQASEEANAYTGKTSLLRLANIVNILDRKILEGTRAKELTESELHDKFLPILEQATKHKDPDIVSSALRMTETHVVPRDVGRKLVHDVLLSDHDMFVKRDALEGIYRICLWEHDEAENYVPMLISLLKEEKDLGVVDLAIGTLGRMGPVAEPAIPYFINRINEDPRNLFYAAFGALKSIKTQKAEEALKMIQPYEPKGKLPPRYEFLRFARTLLMPLILSALWIYFCWRYWAANRSFMVGRFFSALYCFHAIGLILFIILSLITIKEQSSLYGFHQRLPYYMRFIRNFAYNSFRFFPLPLLPLLFIAYANRMVFKAREIETQRVEQDKQVVQKIILLGGAPLITVVISITGIFLLSLISPYSQTLLIVGVGTTGILYGLYFIFILNLRYLTGTIDNLKTFALRCAMPGIIVGATALTINCVILILGYVLGLVI